MCRRSASKNLALNKFYELLHLPLHLFHALAHVEDDRNTRDVHAKIAREVEDEFQTPEILFGVEARVNTSL